MSQSSTSTPPLIAEQLLAGCAAATLMGALDGGLSAFSEMGTRVSGWEFLLACLHLIALYLPVGVLVGLSLAGLFRALRTSPRLSALFRQWSSLTWLLESDPRFFARSVARLGGLAGLALGSGATYHLLATRTHQPALAMWAMAGLSVVIALLSLGLSKALRVSLVPVGRWLGPLASPASLLLILAVATGLGARGWLSAHPSVLRAYRLSNLLWGPLGLLALMASVASLRMISARVRPKPLWVGAVVALASVGLSFTLSGLTYGQSNRARSVVEQRSVLGRLLLRRYAPFTDIDGDGHAWAFGGRDCNDFDASVHPGARDLAGDGVDADCFAGDGSPDVADLSDGHYGNRPEALLERPNFVLVTIDALRPDHLGTFGYERPTSPHIDAFSEEAVRFESVVAQSSRSLRSIPAMFSGRYASQLAFGPEYLFADLLPSNTMLPEILGQNGYRSSVTMGTDYFLRVTHFFQGFDEVNQIPVYKPSRNRPVDEGLQQLQTLAEGERPFFLWIHLFNVHQPYLRPGIPSRFGDRPIDHYDTEIVEADLQFQRVLDTLEELDLEDSTVVMLASDHGEAFGEHGVQGHCTTLYDEEVGATLIVRAPGVEPRQVQGPVALFDLFPTILNLADIPLPAESPSRSLLPLMTGEREVDQERLIFAELIPDGMFPYDIKSVRRGVTKLVWWVQEGNFQYFSTATDPLERSDLSDDNRPEALELLGLLQAWVSETNRPDNVTEDYVAEHRLEEAPANLSHPMDIEVPGAFRVLGFDLPTTHFGPGDRIPLTFYYEVDDEMDDDIFFRVVIEGPAGYRVPPQFHAMHYPLHARYRTYDWRAGEILVDPTPMVVPPGIDEPVSLWISLSLQRRGGGLIAFEHNGRRVHTVRLADLEISSAPHRAGSRTDGGLSDAAVRQGNRAADAGTAAPPGSAVAPGSAGHEEPPLQAINAPTHLIPIPALPAARNNPRLEMLRAAHGPPESDEPESDEPGRDAIRPRGETPQPR